MEDRIPASRTMAACIQKTTRSIWIELFKYGKALSKWGQASREAKDKYINRIEKKWPILHFCKDHWKAVQIATSNYS